MPRPRLGEQPMTSAEKQARRREQFRRMKEALARIAQVKTAKEAREIAQAALSDLSP